MSVNRNAWMFVLVIAFTHFYEATSPNTIHAFHNIGYTDIGACTIACHRITTIVLQFIESAICNEYLRHEM